MSKKVIHIPDKDKWEFDEKVTSIFEDMLKRSIPQYQVMRNCVASLARAYAKESGLIVDLGCSRGDTIESLMTAIAVPCRYIGIDISEPMIATATERFSNFNNVEIEKIDLRKDYPNVENVCLTLLILSLQFIPMEYRQVLLKKAYQSTVPGGALILVEKVLGATADINNLMVDAYYDLKQDNGYSTYEIERKRLSLEGVLVPLASRENEQMLRDAGYGQIDCFWRWMNFSGWIAIKGSA